MQNLTPKIREISGSDPAKCYQCGKCSAGCPMAEEMGFKTHQIIRMLQLGRHQKVIDDPSIFLCLSCETCTARCPNGCDPARLIDAMREVARESSAIPRGIKAFHSALLNQIKNRGRLYELGMTISYKFHSRNFFDDMLLALNMMNRGKIDILPPSHVKGIDEIKRIFEACERVDKEDES